MQNSLGQLETARNPDPLEVLYGTYAVVRSSVKSVYACGYHKGPDIVEMPAYRLRAISGALFVVSLVTPLLTA